MKGLLDWDLREMKSLAKGREKGVLVVREREKVREKGAYGSFMYGLLWVPLSWVELGQNGFNRVKILREMGQSGLGYYMWAPQFDQSDVQNTIE